METLTVRLLNPAERNLLHRIRFAVEEQNTIFLSSYLGTVLFSGVAVIWWIAVTPFLVSSQESKLLESLAMGTASVLLAALAGYCLTRYVLFRRRWRQSVSELHEAARDPYLHMLVEKLAEHESALRQLAESGSGIALLLGKERPGTIDKLFPAPATS